MDSTTPTSHFDMFYLLSGYPPCIHVRQSGNFAYVWAARYTPDENSFYNFKINNRFVSKYGSFITHDIIYVNRNSWGLEVWKMETDPWMTNIDFEEKQNPLVLFDYKKKKGKQ